MQLLSDAVHILYTLRRVVVAEYFGVELTQPLRLVLCQRVLAYKGVDLVDEVVVSLLVFFCLR